MLLSVSPSQEETMTVVQIIVHLDVAELVLVAMIILRECR